MCKKKKKRKGKSSLSPALGWSLAVLTVSWLILTLYHIQGEVKGHWSRPVSAPVCFGHILMVLLALPTGFWCLLSRLAWLMGQLAFYS
jgi:uncharacterized protein with PQ loop repeat